MMQELKANVYSIRAIEWDRRLFDELADRIVARHQGLGMMRSAVAF